MRVAPRGPGMFDGPGVPALQGVHKLVAELLLSCGSGGGPVNVGVCGNPGVPGLVLCLVNLVEDVFPGVRWEVHGGTV
eukprot:10630892-Prorocentrum_lima.AAC.1